MSHFHLGETSAARALVMEYHYSHRWPSNVQVVGTWHDDGGLFGDSGEAVAACVFGYPAARWRQPVLELQRLVRREDARSLSLSGLVAATSAWCNRKGFDILVSYADPNNGHHGGIYQACSWNYHGPRAHAWDAAVINGVTIPSRTLNHVYGTMSIAKLAEMGIDAKPNATQPKHLYWRALGRHGARKAKALDLQSNPYPKPSTAA